MNKALARRGTALLIAISLALALALLFTAGKSSPMFTRVLGLESQPTDSVDPCTNGMRDPGEGDVDCGGICGPCAAGQRCNADTDCDYRTVCDAGTCRQLEWRTDGCEPLVDGMADIDAENLNMVFVGVGYTDIGEFRRQTRRAAGLEEQNGLPGLLFYEPLRSAKAKVNWWYVDQLAPLASTAPDCASACRSTLAEEYCPLLNRQVITLCDTTCAMSAELGGSLYVGEGPHQTYEVVHGFGHSYGFLEDTKDDTPMGNYLRIDGRLPKPNDFSPEQQEKIAERLNRLRGTAYEPWYMVWVMLDHELNIIAAHEDPQSIGETRRIAAPWVLRMNAGSLSYVFDFDMVRRTIVEQFVPRDHSMREERLRYIEIPLPLKISQLSEDKLRLEGYKGTVEPYTIDIVDPSGAIVKRIPGEELAKFLRK